MKWRVDSLLPILVDVSRSMGLNEHGESRFDRARQIVADLQAQLGGDYRIETLTFEEVPASRPLLAGDSVIIAHDAQRADRETGAPSSPARVTAVGTIERIEFAIFQRTHVLFGRVIVDGLGSAVAADRIPQNRERPEQQIDDAQAVFADDVPESIAMPGEHFVDRGVQRVGLLVHAVRICHKPGKLTRGKVTL